MLKKFMTMLAASLALFAAGTAQAGSAQALSLARSPAIVRAAGNADDASQLAGPGAYLIGAIAAGLVVWGVVELVDDSDSN